MELEAAIGSVDAEYRIPVVELCLGDAIGDGEVIAVVSLFRKHKFGAAAGYAGLCRAWRCDRGAGAAGRCDGRGGATSNSDAVVDLHDAKMSAQSAFSRLQIA